MTWKKEEPTSFTIPYAKSPGPTSPTVNSLSTPGNTIIFF